MGSRGAAATLQLMMMVVATFALAAAIFMSTVAADCPGKTELVASGGFRHPEGGEEGLYMGTVEVDEEGVKRHKVKYLGKSANTTTFDGSWPANKNVSRPGGGHARKLLQDSGAHCEHGFTLDEGDIYYAVGGLSEYFGFGGNTVEGGGIVYSYYGCTVAYACNFGDGNMWTTSGALQSDHHFISTACTTTGAGWYSHESWSATFGRTSAALNFCWSL